MFKKVQTVKANTRQVRVVGNYIAGFAAQYTEKTSKLNPRRRSIVWMYNKRGVATVVAKLLRAEFARLGYANSVSVTGGQYVRVIADLA
jgi:hypothetical protein